MFHYLEHTMVCKMNRSVIPESISHLIFWDRASHLHL